jgi:putative ABC transport system permease protein
MPFVALKMLIGDRSKSLGITMGLTFASLFITQQTGIFVGLMTPTYGFITDTGRADIWVMDAKVQFVVILCAGQGQIRGRSAGIDGGGRRGES